MGDRKRKRPASPRGTRLWLFRLAALILAPILALGGLELGLRLAGYGYDPAFLVPVAGTPDRGRGAVLTTNPRFGWRFFPHRLARSPVPFELVEDGESSDRYRIFVLGGSAARGTPDSAYSFGRVLQAMLEERYPDTRFEVINAAMTAINSHVVLPIARACARHDPDLFVVYLGNNEMVGPYGAATIFRPFSPSRSMIRAGVALRALRLGQLADALLARIARTDEGPRQWRGMEMFLEQRIAAEDPRLAPVYEHLRRNLADVVGAAAGAGARTLLVTVATNLRDQPPFASLHRRDLGEEDLARWQASFDDGVAAIAEERWEVAAASLEAAAEIDASPAELHFHLGRARLGLGHLAAANESLVRARDLDALRFRADSRVNRVIRDVAAAEAGRGAVLVDAERALAEASAGGIPGSDLFYEHVHLNFAGNYALAKAVFAVLEEQLPAAIRRRSREAPLPPVEAVAELLALTPFDEHDLEQEILQIVSRPPFSGQHGHGPRIEAMRRRLAVLRRGLTPEVWDASAAIYRGRLELRPDDIELRRRFAAALQARGRAEEAAAQWRTLVERLPGIPVWHGNLALALADSGRSPEALAELEGLLRTWGDDPAILVNLGTVLEKEERWDEATERYRRALALDPDDAVAGFNLATALLRSGDADRAVGQFDDLLARHPAFASAHHNLGHAYEQRGDLRAAVASYRRAVAAEPDHAGAHNSLGLALEQLGQLDEAREHYLAAIDYQPDFALARFNLADLLLSRGGAAEAAVQYREGLRYRPDNAQARFNLAAALVASGEHAAAALELRRVLDARGEDPGALQRLAWILATTEDPDLRDVGAAVELAERAAAATDHRSAEILDTLAAAYAFAGRRAEAVATLKRAVELARATDREPLVAALERRLAALQAL